MKLLYNKIPVKRIINLEHLGMEKRIYIGGGVGISTCMGAQINLLFCKIDIKWIISFKHFQQISE